MSSIRHVEALLNTLEHEKHQRGALLAAFLDELRALMTDRAPESTRDLLAKAAREEMADGDFDALLQEMRALVRTAA